jgi:putative transposase
MASARREAVAILVERHEMSERRACAVIGADRTSIRYQRRRPEDHGLRERLRVLASERRRFGYRRLHVLLGREGHVVNRKKTQRLCREEGLSVRRRRGRKKATGTRAPRLTIARRGRPGLIVSDHGTEFTSNAMLAWSEETGVPWHFIAPGKPMRDTGSARPSIRRCGTSS